MNNNSRTIIEINRLIPEVLVPDNPCESLSPQSQIHHSTAKTYTIIHRYHNRSSITYKDDNYLEKLQ